MKTLKIRRAGAFRGPKPEILAPAGNQDAFLAALAAGADAVYCGLKHFSARMAAKNFTLAELASLADLARRRKTKVYLTINTLIKPDELVPLGQELESLNRYVKPDALIIQDLAVAALARQCGFEGELHLSTLANVSAPAALERLGKKYGVQRVVLPRELNVDEIKQMADACPNDLGLELFVHGALCYGVSGRCYWSSYMGGKSGLRGRCVQPCRRRYSHDRQNERFFACQDFSLDVLVKTLAPLPQVRAWKIEGRKKGPHYVYYTVTAYKMLRDEGQDPQIKKAAVQLLEQALGRPTTHYHFLPQRPQNPIQVGVDSGSGLLVGTVRGTGGKPFLQPRLPLMPHDRLRIGYEDDAWHQTLDIPVPVPKQGKFVFKPFKGQSPEKGTPVFLIDRREPALADKIDKLAAQLTTVRTEGQPSAPFSLRLPTGSAKQPRAREMTVLRRPGRRVPKSSAALWLDLQTWQKLSVAQQAHSWWWLPPVIWPDEEAQWQETIGQLLKQGARKFVLNTPWQIAYFKRPAELSLWAGPFCNITNPLAIRAFKLAGGHGVIVGPELGKEDLTALPSKSVLPLGIVVSGHWPFCVSRALAEGMKTGEPFVSPKGEQGWVRRYGSLFWVYPNWGIDLQFGQETLVKAGFRLFVHLDEYVPKPVKIKNRPGRWNWDIGLK